ncbi:hypothetical protein UFOVP611_44 [uncultured Caudovirales phage]|uniref:Uncharacterized protein n=1 Tax=uncultured Caudovirales phage TaxID=2100421 RepID=A0A6J5N2Q7_9CAUD|nr:hypothetical protein UFOVP611_44 [uncultured Caudovirales phage]
MKTTIKIIVFCLLFSNVNANVNEVNLDTAQNVFTSETTNGDTLTKHKVFEIDDHLIICDTIIIKTPEVEFKTVIKEKNGLRSILIPLFALTFAVIAIILKRKNNG